MLQGPSRFYGSLILWLVLHAFRGIDTGLKAFFKYVITLLSYESLWI